MGTRRHLAWQSVGHLWHFIKYLVAVVGLLCGASPYTTTPAVQKYGAVRCVSLARGTRLKEQSEKKNKKTSNPESRAGLLSSNSSNAKWIH